MTLENRHQTFCNKLRNIIKQQLSWSKHYNHSCLKCLNCNCGKHKCKIQAPHLSLSHFQSNYNQNFYKKLPASQSQKRKCTLSDEYNPKLLISQSQYRSSYNDKIKQSSKPKPQIHNDNIKVGGPTFTTTTYGNFYTENKYVPTSPLKNPQNLVCTPGLSMKHASNYRQTFKWYVQSSKKRNKPIKRADHLKTQHGPFISQTSYSSDYPLLSSYAKVKQSFAPQLAYRASKGILAKSTYSAHYCPKIPNVCPAEHLQ